jgi:hypothetical protein
MSICPICEKEFQQLRRPKTFCSRDCSNVATAGRRAASNRALGKYAPPQCPCGNDVSPPEGQKWVYASQKKYCSPECRLKYGKKKQANPENYVTFTCLVCEEKITRYKKYGNGANKYCSNRCAAKHTKRVAHVIIRDHDTVLDSGWEALFYGLCKFMKIPIDRYERVEGVEWWNDSWYAPDFVITTAKGTIAIEIKGNENPDDIDKWNAFRHAMGPLVVVDQQVLNALRKAINGVDFQNCLFRLSGV